jgi:hypothetical protein
VRSEVQKIRELNASETLPKDTLNDDDDDEEIRNKLCSNKNKVEMLKQLT